MAKMTGGQALAKSLYVEGVQVVFGMPGVQLYHAMDGLYDEPGIRLVTVRHEQAASYMADGYARASGGIGTALVVPGPGLLNAASGIGTAYAASSPILIVAGQVPRDLMASNRGVLHEIDDQLECIRPITKWSARVLDPADIPTAVHEAFRQLKTGRPRPVEIEIPPETLAEEADITLMEPEEYERPAPSRQRIKRAAEILAGASNPAIWAGGGVISSGAGEALRKLAEHLQAPVISTAEGRGAVSDRHYLCVGNLRRDNDPYMPWMARHDVILAVGTRIAYPNLLNGQRVIQIDIDPAEPGRNYENTFGVVGDARRSLEGLHEVIAASIPARPSGGAEIEAIKEAKFGPSSQKEPLRSFVKAIRAAIPDDGILVAGMTQVGYYSRVFYPVYQPRTYLTSSYFGTLGFVYPVALGAKVACPDKAVVAVSGDGGFLFNSQELATAVQFGINAVVIVFNDNAFGNVLRDQEVQFKGRIIGSELHNPDFVKLAEAYGARGVRAEGPEQLEASLREALALDAPTLIEVPVGPMPNPF